ncbi:prepilin-type N-terminal cleavage/methylation domain-containing protein [Sulfurospirillum sp. 1612]|uniref:prepilin-type N-terminal cleavage/methylation domain-containing protein n=1 Tax=Sulfurospirillum sp. 1612 TaxID=3094835 RepID=UPI002F94AD05
MKKAFTMMELVFVIVIIGIISAMIAPNFQRNSVREAADQLISHIRYTQHLAMIDDQYNPSDPNWYEKRWQLLIGKSSSGTLNSGGYYAYTIFSDTSTSGNPDPGEIATNPLDNTKLLSGGFSNTLDWEDERATKALNIGSKYGITNVTTSGCAGAKRIAFDYLGRPIKGNISSDISPYRATSATISLLTSQCAITITDGTTSVTIAIEPETGYAHIL